MYQHAALIIPQMPLTATGKSQRCPRTEGPSGERSIKFESSSVHPTNMMVRDKDSNREADH